VRISALVLVILLSGGVARAVEPAPPSTPLVGELELLRDRHAGAFEDVRRHSRQVSYVRDGSERPALPGMGLHEQDALRTAEGVCALVSADGLRIEVGERSQLRLERGVIQRLGRVLYEAPGPLSVRVGEVELATAGARFEVQSTTAGAGTLLVSSGEVQVRAPAGELRADAGTRVSFSQDGPATAEPALQLWLDDLERWRADRFDAAEAAPPSQRDRARIRLDGGVSWFEDLQGWGRGGLAARVRLGGPLWVSAGAAFAGRRAWELEEVENVYAVPTHLGLRLSGDLPRSFFISGGADFQMVVISRCDDQTTCTREVDAEPGGRLLIGGGLLLSRRFGMDLEFSGGILRRRIPPIVEGGETTDVVDPQFHVGFGFFLRL